MKEQIEGYNFIGQDKTIEVTENDELIKISVALTYDQIKSLQNLNLEISSIIQNVYYNEIIQTVNKMIINSIINKNKDNIIQLNDDILHKDIINLLEKEKSDKEIILITNGKVGVEIQDIPNFNSTYNVKDLTNITIYKLGNYNNVSIYIDPYKKWNDDTIHILKNNFFNLMFIEKEEITNKSIILGKTYIKIDNNLIDSDTYYMNNVVF
jgi:hypothetical protein